MNNSMKIIASSTAIALIAGLSGCSASYDPEPASTTMSSIGYGNTNRHGTCAQLRSRLSSLGYSNSDVVSMKDRRAAPTIVAYKANGCEK